MENASLELQKLFPLKGNLTDQTLQKFNTPGYTPPPGMKSITTFREALGRFLCFVDHDKLLEKATGLRIPNLRWYGENVYLVSENKVFKIQPGIDQGFVDIEKLTAPTEITFLIEELKD